MLPISILSIFPAWAGIFSCLSLVYCVLVMSPRLSQGFVLSIGALAFPCLRLHPGLGVLSGADPADVQPAGLRLRPPLTSALSFDLSTVCVSSRPYLAGCN